MKTVKIIAVWAGSRRHDASGWQDTFADEEEIIQKAHIGLDGPKEELSLFKYTVEKEMSLDYGCPMDIFFVNAMPHVHLRVSDDYQRFKRYFDSVNGTKTKNGKIFTAHRPNLGISFGSFNWAFQKYKNEYDYWMFSEDDYIIVKDYAMAMGIEKLDEETPFVATIANKLPHRKERRKHAGLRQFAHGGQGVTSTEKLILVSKMWDFYRSDDCIERRWPRFNFPKDLEERYKGYSLPCINKKGYGAGYFNVKGVRYPRTHVSTEVLFTGLLTVAEQYGGFDYKIGRIWEDSTPAIMAWGETHPNKNKQYSKNRQWHTQRVAWNKKMNRF